MATAATLQVDFGHTSLAGLRARNEDYCAGAIPDGDALENKGVILGIADGVGGHANGREAAEYCIRNLLADYYATPDTWSIPQSLEKLIVALNRWLYSNSRRARESAGMATTLSALVLRGQRYVIAHVGDTRIYLLRRGELSLLTLDHVWQHPELNNVLSRAVGLDANLAVDFVDGRLEIGDRFLMVCDGIWAVLDDARLTQLLSVEDRAEDIAAHVAMAAIEAGSHDNCTAMVCKVIDLPAESLRDNVAHISTLPLPDRLMPTQRMDGLEIMEVIHDSRITVLYRVYDDITRQTYVLKTLHPDADAADIAALAYEEWLARRVVNAAFPQVIHWPQRTHLYYLTSWHAGASLAGHLETGRRFTVMETVDLAMHLLRAIAVLHRLGIIHRDIKPDNLHLGADGHLRVLDLGVAASDGLDVEENFNEINNPGTPSFMAPELYAGSAANESTDLYSVGVTLYYLLTRKYPYGEVEPFQTPRFGDPVPPARYRPDIPDWLESILLKGVARDPVDRFETAEEFLLALEHGAQRPLRVARRSPLFKRDPTLPVKLFAGISFMLNILLLVLWVMK